MFHRNHRSKCNLLQASQCKAFQEALNKTLIEDSHPKPELTQIVLEVELLQQESICGFHENKKSSFLKVMIISIWNMNVYFLFISLQITLALPKFIAASKRLSEQGEIEAPFNGYAYQAYESNIDFEIR